MTAAPGTSATAARAGLEARVARPRRARRGARRRSRAVGGPAEDGREGGKGGLGGSSKASPAAVTQRLEVGLERGEAPGLEAVRWPRRAGRRPHASRVEHQASRRARATERGGARAVTDTTRLETGVGRRALLGLRRAREGLVEVMPFDEGQARRVGVAEGAGTTRSSSTRAAGPCVSRCRSSPSSRV